MTDQGNDTESIALRTLAASGLFVAGVVLAIAGLVGAVQLLDALNVHGDTQLVGTFAVVAVPAAGLLLARRWRALGAGLVVGMLLGALAIFWFVAMFHPYGTE